ncbi:MAG: YfhO family protein [Anaerolineae bacterium]
MNCMPAPQPPASRHTNSQEQDMQAKSETSGMLFWQAVAAWLWPLSLCVLPLLFWPGLAVGRVLVGVDLFTYFYPLRDAVSASLRAGQFPLWNPYLFLGVPLFANIQAGTLYPVNLVLSGLPAPYAVNAFILFHLALAGVGTYVYGRWRGLERPGAWTAGAIFSLGGFLSAQAEHINQLAVSALLPWMLWCLERAAGLRGGARPARTRPAWWLALAILLATAFLAGHTQSWYIALFTLALDVIGLAAWRIGQAGRAGWREAGTRAGKWLVGRTAALGLAAGTALALCAVQLLPTLELSGLSIRAGGMSYREAVSFSLKPQLLVRTFLPGYGEMVFSEYVGYIGWVGLALALWGLLAGKPHRVRWAGAGLALAGLFLAFGGYNPFYYVLYRLIPGFSLFRAPARWLVLYALGSALLAGAGLDAWTAGAHPQRLWEMVRRRRGFITAGIFLILAVPTLGLAVGWLEQPSLLTAAGWGVTLALLAGVLGITYRSSVLWRGASIAGLMAAELFLAGRSLPLASPTAWDAFASLRTAPAHLLAAGLHLLPDGRPAAEADMPAVESMLGDATAHWGRGAPTFRFLSMSGIQYDPGDLADIYANWRGRLPEKAVYDLVVTAKQKEVLAPNLPLLYRIAAVDGYDGGVLPLRRYVTLQSLFLPPEDILPDGRLREQLRQVPSSRLLALLNVEYVITDKVWDVWIDDVFYDLQFGAVLGAGGRPEIAVDNPYTFTATEIGMVSYLEGCAGVPHGTPVAELRWEDAAGAWHAVPIRAGRETAEGRADADAGHARVGRRGEDGRVEYAARLSLGGAHTPAKLMVRWLGPAEGRLVIRGISLIDGRTGAHRSLVVSDRGRFRLVHSGDVKIYRNLDNLPRAYLVGKALAVGSDEEALNIMRQEEFDPHSLVLLHDAPAEDFGWAGNRPAEIVRYTPEEVILHTQFERPAYLVLSDAYYPGWRAFVDGREFPILRANLMFRAVALPAGEHTVVFRYMPASLRTGAVVSLTTLLACFLGMMVRWLWERRR